MENKTTFEKVPQKAFVLAVDGDNRFEFKETSDGSQVPRLEMTIYSGKVIKDHWWWGDLVIDLSGMSFPKAKYPLLEDHYSRIGFFGKPIVSNEEGLRVDPDTVKFLDNERSRQIIEDGKNGFPFEASIRAEPILIQRLSKDESVEVNGFTMKGPGTVWRKSVFKEGSICIFGYDSKTSAKIFKEEESEVEIETVVKNIEETDEFTKEDGGEITMDLKELKEKHPDLVKAIADETSSLLSETYKKEKEDLVTEFSKKLKDSDEKILELQKAEAIRVEKDRVQEADNIWSMKLKASEIPEHLHEKVRGHVVHDRFVEGEVFDREAFSNKVVEEIKDWEKRLTDSFSANSVRGQGGGVRKVDGGPDDGDENKLSKSDEDVIKKLRRFAGEKVE